ncbi:Scarecrow-like protein 14 [Ancistrocladus abbreviatus]
MDEAQQAMMLELQKGEGQSLEQNGQPQGSDGRRGHSKKQVNDKNAVDLRTFLILCAQATASDDRRTADELLKQIRQHSSPEGDGSQRLAHYFANALEARLAGTGSQIYTALASKRTTAADIIKAFQFYIAACPFKKISIVFAVHMILKAAEKATKLHIIDFGILYGFYWPILIQRLSERAGEPPKLCITGIDFPLPGFRPAERVEATGRRLAKYCEQFNVPFEYHAIAQKWETIKLEDLKISGDGVVAVSCLYRLRNLLDETIVVDSPRNAVLNLIREINPDIYVNASVNGSFNAPFFITRFKEALFHFSTLFDMFDANVARERPERLIFEKEFYGREIMNVVACEGTERVERPETYKLWQVRITKAGFKQVPLDPELLKKLMMKLRTPYHKDFLIDVDGHWVLQGWKGRMTCAISAWVPS